MMFVSSVAQGLNSIGRYAHIVKVHLSVGRVSINAGCALQIGRMVNHLDGPLVVEERIWAFPLVLLLALVTGALTLLGARVARSHLAAKQRHKEEG